MGVLLTGTTIFASGNPVSIIFISTMIASS
jgi:hypothetical protein